MPRARWLVTVSHDAFTWPSQPNLRSAGRAAASAERAELEALGLAGLGPGRGENPPASARKLAEAAKGRFQPGDRIQHRERSSPAWNESALGARASSSFAIYRPPLASSGAITPQPPTLSWRRPMTSLNSWPAIRVQAGARRLGFPEVRSQAAATTLASRTTGITSGPSGSRPAIQRALHV